MNPLFLLNSPVLTAYGQWQFLPVSLMDARKLVETDFISAIGHESTAQLLSQLLEKEIICQRISITMQPQDRALIFRIKKRLPDTRELTQAEISQLSYEFGLLRYLSE
ncbi:DUF1874 domain-containing protein [Candidatus Albibeggiatoa sp. nov. BB20]|uniref:STIV orfB116 family protein n=1 Tax=Candidatus Albibeggiatoa sp. nov. BB20 TaxID=3162723 RepID=UPI00336570D2